MPERPIYFTKPDQEEKTQLDVKGVGCVTLFAGGMYGGIAGGVSNLFWGPEVGLRVGAEVGIGTASFMGGITLGLISAERAEDFAKEGRKGRAYIEALRGCLEYAIGFAVAGGTAGYGIADVPGAVIGGSIGGLVGSVGLGQVTFGSVSRAVKNRESV